MKISLKLEYAFRVLAQLGRLYGGNQLAHIEELAKIEAVPQNYLVQILNQLREGGLLHSRRGKQGGYCLVKPPAEITLFAIVSVIDPDLIEANVSRKGQSGAQVAEVWHELTDRFKRVLTKTSLAALIPHYDASTLYDI